LLEGSKVADVRHCGVGAEALEVLERLTAAVSSSVTGLVETSPSESPGAVKVCEPV